jgi:hypothetical protein
MVDANPNQSESTGEPGADRRAHPRVATQGVRCLLGRVVDLSPGGLCVEHEGHWRFEINDAFDVVIWQGDCELLASVRVVWVEPMGAGGSRLGLEFVSNGPKLEQAVREIARRGCGQLIGPQCWYAA